MTLLEFPWKDAEPATQIAGRARTCQAHKQFLAPPIFYWQNGSLDGFYEFLHETHSLASQSRAHRKNALTLVKSGHLMKSDDRLVIRATQSSHLFSHCVTRKDLGTSRCVWRWSTFIFLSFYYFVSWLVLMPKWKVIPSRFPQTMYSFHFRCNNVFMLSLAQKNIQAQARFSKKSLMVKENEQQWKRNPRDCQLSLELVWYVCVIFSMSPVDRVWAPIISQHGQDRQWQN